MTNNGDSSYPHDKNSLNGQGSDVQGKAKDAPRVPNEKLEGEGKTDQIKGKLQEEAVEKKA